MNLDNKQIVLKKRVEELIETASNYRFDKLEDIYSKDLKIVILSAENEIMTFNYDENMAFFKSKKDNGDAPLDTTADFKNVEVDGDLGYVVVVRTMKLMGKEQDIVFNLTLANKEGSWKIIREFAVIK